MIIRNAFRHFIDFHRGIVNIVLHVIGFAGIIYSIYKSDWTLFLFSFLVVEAGHIYNHVIGLKPYDMRWRVILLRLIVFVVVIAIFYLFLIAFKSAE